MSYTQNNPLSRKSSPLNDGDWIQKATASIKERGTEGVCTGDKFGGPTCPPGSKRYNLAKTFKKMAKKRKGGPSRESSNSPLNQDGKPVEETRRTKGDQMPSRKSSSPLNQGVTGFGRTGNAIMDARRTLHDMENYASDDFGYEQAPGYTGQIFSWNPEAEIESGREDVRLKTIHRDLREGFGQDTQGHTEDIDHHTEALDEREGPPRKSSSPLNNTGMTGLNYSKELRYNAIDDITQGKGEADYGMSRKSSSPLDHASWANEDSKRAKKLYKEGDYAHAHALGIDEHDADYAKHWEHGEHGTSRRSSSPLNDEGHGGAPGHGHATMTKKIGQIEKKPVSPRSKRLRERAMKLSEGVEGQGGYDYENEKVMKLLNRANKIDEKN